MGKSHTSFLPAAGVVLLAVWPLFFREAMQFYQVLGLTCLFATLALAWNLYALSGAISLGHAAFFGLGEAGGMVAALPLWLAVVGGLAVASLWIAGFGALANRRLGV